MSRVYVADDLILFADNDGALYRQKTSIIANMHRKMKAGKYDPELAVKLWMYFVDAAAKKYAQDLRESGSWNKIFPRPVRLEAARHYAKTEHRRIQDGEYSEWPPVGRDRHRRRGARSKLSAAQKKFLARKIRKVSGEGYPRKQAVAIAYSYARKRPKRSLARRRSRR